MKIRTCPHCGNRKRDNSPVSYVWWFVMGKGLMCWHCYQKESK